MENRLQDTFARPMEESVNIRLTSGFMSRLFTKNNK